MSYDNKPGTGALFKNRNKKSDAAPDYRGPYYEKVGDGVVEREIAAWAKISQKGENYLSIKVGDKFVPRKSHAEQSQAGTSHKDYSRDFDDDIPL